MDKIYLGEYMRLSNDDGYENIESNSIGSQRSIINQYVSANLPSCVEIREYVDDGYTGLNFNRPDFQRMLQDIEKGFINTIIVKDLSRFGRDYIETGKYIFRDFKEQGVRVIAINDNYDSANTNNSDNFMMPMRTMMNNYYSLDISEKVQRSFRAKQSEGKFTGSHAGYGFIKDPTDKHKLLIDENVAPIIRMIFDLYIEGHGKQSIAKILNDRNIPCPTEYKKLMGSKYCNGNRLFTTTYWTYSTIHKILSNEMYIGNMVLNRTKRVTPRGKAQMNNKEDWIITENTHEAIVSREKWDLVQQLLKRRGSQLDFNENIALFAGFIECADCGRAMAKATYQTQQGKVISYICRSYRAYGSDICTRHGVKSEILEQAVLNKLNEYVAKANVEIDAIKAKVSTRGTELKKQEEKLAIIKQRKRKLFETYSDGIISKEEYIDIKSNYEEEEKQCKALMEVAKQEEQSQGSEKMAWLEHLQKYHSIEKLDRGILAETLEKIYVKEDSEGIHIDIRFKFSLE